MKQVNPLYAIVMAMDDATLARLRQWLKRVAHPLTVEFEERSRVATRAREWRDRRRGRPPRPVTNWKTATVCALAQHPLTPENVREAIRLVKPYGVDVASGVESSPGRKDPGKVKAFVAEARDGFAEIGLG